MQIKRAASDFRINLVEDLSILVLHLFATSASFPHYTQALAALQGVSMADTSVGTPSSKPYRMKVSLMEQWELEQQGIALWGEGKSEVM